MSKTQAERVLAFIRANPGCTTMELQLTLRPFCANPRARISDLRANGYTIQMVRRDDGRNGFRVVEPEPVQVALFFAETA